MISFLLAFAMLPRPCPLAIGVGKDGALFTDRFRGWYKTSSATLREALRMGCYNDGDPQPISSITLLIAPNAPKPKIAFALSVLQQNGWPREKIDVEPWIGYPSSPRAQPVPEHDAAQDGLRKR